MPPKYFNMQSLLWATLHCLSSTTGKSHAVRTARCPWATEQRSPQPQQHCPAHQDYWVWKSGPQLRSCGLEALITEASSRVHRFVTHEGGKEKLSPPEPFCMGAGRESSICSEPACSAWYTPNSLSQGPEGTCSYF